MREHGGVSRPTPHVHVDRDVLERNIDAMQRASAGAGLAFRPHAKTHKSLHVGRLQVAAGASGLTVGTLGEAEVFAAGGLDDLFIAYPLVPRGPKAERLAALVVLGDLGAELSDSAGQLVGLDQDLADGGVTHPSGF